MNGKQAAPPQQPPKPDTFQEILVVTDDDTTTHPYAQQQVNMGPDGGVLLVQETKGDRCFYIYPLNRVCVVKMTPTRLAAV
jgi:hypothetical protein